MTTHTVETRINAPKDVVWKAASDFGGVWKYNPNVTKSYSLGDANGGVGAERHCDLTFSGASVDERIVDWTDGSNYAIEIYDGKKLPPIKNVIARIAVRDDGDGTVVSGTLSYDTKLGPIGWVMDRLMISKNFGKAWQGVFAGLKHHVETGETVGKESPLPYERVSYAAA